MAKEIKLVEEQLKWIEEQRSKLDQFEKECLKIKEKAELKNQTSTVNLTIESKKRKEKISIEVPQGKEDEIIDIIMNALDEQEVKEYEYRKNSPTGHIIFIMKELSPNLKDFIYRKNGWIDDKVPKEIIKKASRNKNINGEKIMRLFLDGKCIYKGPVQFCQKKKKDYCLAYNLSNKDEIKRRFKITY